MTSYLIEHLPERLAAKIAVNPVTGCWEWQGSRDQDGYGQIKWRGRVLRVHRVVFELLERPIPDGLLLDHVHALGCRSKACCWPAHLEPVTNAENLRRAGLLITHCPAGHGYTEANTYTPPGGARHCRACKNGQPPAWATVLVCPCCGESRTGPPGRYCGSCRCLHANAHGRRCGNVATLAGFCDYHSADRNRVAVPRLDADSSLTREDAA